MKEKQSFFRFFFLFPVLFSFLFFVTCSSSSDSSSSSNEYEMQNLPDSYSVQIPDSVKGENTSTKGGQDTVDSDLNSMGYKHLQDGLKDVEKQNTKIATLFVVIDAAIQKLDKKFTDEPVKELSITLTEEMLNKIKSIGGKKPGFIKEDGKVVLRNIRFVGPDRFSTEIVPEHDKLLKQMDKLKSLYNFLFVLKGAQFGGGGDDFAGKKILYVFWNTDKNKVRTVSCSASDITLPDGKTDVNKEVIDLIYEDSKENGKFASVMYSWDAPPYVWDNAVFKWVLKSSKEVNRRDIDVRQAVLREIDSDKKSIMFQFYKKQRRLMGDETKPESMKKIEHSIVGFADKEGAYIGTNVVKEKEIMKIDGSKNQSFSFGNQSTDAAFVLLKFDEICDAKGVLKYAQIYKDAWVKFMEYSWDNSNYYFTTYNEYKIKYKDKFDKFLAGNGNKEALQSYVSGNDIVLEVKLPSTIRTEIEKGIKSIKLFLVVKNQPLVTDAGSGLFKMSEYTLSRTGMFVATYNDLKTLHGETDIRARFVIDPKFLTSDYQSLTKDTLAASYDIHLLSTSAVVDSATGFLTSSSGISISATVNQTIDDKAIVYQ